MHDPGMVYIFGFAAMLAAAAITMFFAKRALDKRPNERKKMTMKPIYACSAGSSALMAAAVIKLTVFADFYNTYSMYAPAA